MDTVEKMPQSFASVRCHTSLEQHNRHAGIQTCTQTTIQLGNSVKILFWTSQIFKPTKRYFGLFLLSHTKHALYHIPQGPQAQGKLNSKKIIARFTNV